MPSSVKYGGLPFEEANDFLRQKINLPTEKWTDLFEGMHARAFTVAGATSHDLVADFRSAIEQAQLTGTTLQTFRKDFDKIVKSHGWSYNGSRNWRSQLIYGTNLRTAYAAGRFKQTSDPEVRKRRPYLMYRHGDSARPRPEHLAWDGLVLAADDPWWDTHTPPNGWGCKCKVFTLNERELRALGKEEPDTAPPISKETVDLPGRGEVRVPKGIDPGWGYNVGAAAWGRPLAEAAMAQWQAEGAKAWKRLDTGNYESAGRPAKVPLDQAAVSLAPRTEPAGLETAIEKQLGAPERAFELQTNGFTNSVSVNAATLAKHIESDRAPFLPLLPKLLEDPFEVWSSFEEHKGTGRVVLRQRFIRAFSYDGGKKGVLLVAQAVKGQMEAWTFVPVKSISYLNGQRYGKLIYARKG